MKAKHTPGPWNAFVGEDGGFVISPDDNLHICLCSRSPWPQRGKESGANARLISAAPDLLAALNRLVHLTAILPPDMDEPGSAMADARAAIAKATGGEA